MTKFVQIGKVTLSLQSLLTLIFGFVASLSVLVMGKFRPSAIATSLLMLASLFYTAYIINCTLVGNCTVLAWVMTSVYIFYAVVVFALPSIPLLAVKDLKKK